MHYECPRVTHTISGWGKDPKRRREGLQGAPKDLNINDTLIDSTHGANV